MGERLELDSAQECDHDRDKRRKECGARLGRAAAVQVVVSAHGRADGDPALVQLHLLARAAVAVGGLARVLAKLVLVHPRDLKRVFQYYPFLEAQEVFDIVTTSDTGHKIVTSWYFVTRQNPTEIKWRFWLKI